MTGRPETLFPLFSELTALPGVGPKTAANFAGLRVAKPKDLLFTLPYAVLDRRPVGTVQGVTPGKTVTVQVTVGRHTPGSTRVRPYRVTVTDEDISFDLIFFQARGDYLQKQLPTGSVRIISGKLDHFDGRAQITHPDYILPADKADQIPHFEAIYPLTAGVTSKTMTRAVAGSLDITPKFEEWIEPSLLKSKAWPSFNAALEMAHSPQALEDVLPIAPARQRLAYDELLAHQITKAIARTRARLKSGRSTVGTGVLEAKVLAGLPYAPTGAQRRAVYEIQHDMQSPHRMNRLLQGDVGSGKTLVALLALVHAVEAGGQGALMAPTEILARQHMEGLQALGASVGVRIDLLTGRDKGAARRAKLAALHAGKIDILIGTHALFQEDVVFKDLRMAIIDEQHRFGVAQRMALGSKGTQVDVLVMTATPIPRSLELAQFGDMDVSTLDEKPPGRQPITTAAVPMERMDQVIAKLKTAIAQGKQAYWVCPLVEESEVMDLTAAEERFKRLRAALGDDVVGLVHGQMPSADKDAAMEKFVDGKSQVLVATTVIEVGVNVPNATIMVIERAETFGLAQLHQLRGRVGRGTAASTCLLMYQAPLSETGQKRLNIMRETEDGFRIAQTDLEMRGAGDVIGTAQSGLPRFRVADLERQSGLMETAQKDARMLLYQDPELQSPRGQAVRTLLWLMEQDKAIGLINVG
ncbi:MAG: ATP-dependent DNA helicase RecG [Planktomarina sp.]